MVTFDFADKVVLVTGASHGIGLATAREFLKAGAKVMLNGSTQGRLDGAMEKLGAFRESAVAYRADVRNTAEVEAMFKALLAKWGRIDILVNNAGGTQNRVAKVADLTDEQWDAVVDTNLRGTFLCCRAAARQMIAQGPGGKIITTASGSWKNAREGVSSYCASKAGVVMFTACLAQELGRHGINVNCVAPGLIDTKDVKTPNRVAYESATESLTPWGRMGKPEEIAYVTLMLCSPQAEYVTGAVLGVDGGLSVGRYGIPMAKS